MVTQENTWTKPDCFKEKEGGDVQHPPFSQQQPQPAPLLQPSPASYAGFTPVPAQSQPQPAPVAEEKGRPISSSAVPGTPWCVVWTGDGKVFFFNPSTKTSVWERPPELYNRTDVDALVAKPPDVNNKRKHQESEDESDTENNIKIGNEEGEDSEGSEDSAPKKKKNRREKKAQRQLEQKRKEEEAKKVEQQKKKPAEKKEEDPAVKAEREAQEKRATIPLEERILQFRQLLEDKNVSPSSTWTRELSKIVFDERYLLLSAPERKAAFETYTKEKAEEERIEKKKRAKEAKEGFKALLEEANLHGKSTFTSFSSKFGKDDRFKAVEKMRDREDMFKEFVEELYKAEKEEKRKEKDKAKEAFNELLKEQEDLHKKSKWSHVKKKIDHDERYKHKYLDSSLREDLFRAYASTLSEKEVELEEGEEPDSTADVEMSAADRAIADRKREVAEQLDEHMKEKNKESEKQRYQEQEDLFKSMLIDIIKNTDLSYHDARKLLKKDPKYDDIDLLDKSTKESIYYDHVRSLEKKKRELFYQLLNENENITYLSRWRDVRKIIESDEKYAKVITKKAERDFEGWVDKQKDKIYTDFDELLRETKIITYQSQKQIQENEQHLKDILAILENDSRYLILKDEPDKRERLLETYLRELDRKGPPPPPTATEPDRNRH